jgi:hypothetical protein
MRTSSTFSIPGQLKAIASVSGLALFVTNCLVASDGRDGYLSTSSTVGAGTVGTVGAGGATGTGTTVTSGSGGTVGSAGSGGSACSGPTPAGAASCGPGKTCLADCTTHKNTCYQPGTGIDGSACTSIADCRAGMDCVAYSDTVSLCKTLCSLDRDCPAGYACTGGLECSSSDPTPTGRVCDKPCSDVTETGVSSCGARMKCALGCNGSTPVTACAPAGTFRAGPCAYNTDCAAGFVCAGNVCRQVCRVTVDCPIGMSCKGSATCGSTPSGYSYCQ